MRVLFISTFLDSPIHSNRAPYNEQLIERLSEDMDIEVIRPISWLDWLNYFGTRYRQKSCVNRSRKIHSIYPVLFYIPFIGSVMSGWLYFLSILIVSVNKVRKADVLYASWLYPDGYAVMLLAKLFNKPYMVQALGSDINELLFSARLQKQVKAVVHNASVVSVVSQDLKRKLVEQGVDKDKVVVIYTGIEKSTFYPVAKFIAQDYLGLPPLKRILYIGNLKRAKGINDLLLAVEMLSRTRQDFELCVAGGGSEAALLQQYVSQYPNLIRSLGVIDHKRLHWWINASSCVCLPSYSEGVPNVLLEAMICETNVVATNVGGIPEVIADPAHYLIDAGDGVALVSLLNRMLDESNFVTKPSFLIPTYQQMALQVKECLLSM